MPTLLSAAVSVLLNVPGSVLSGNVCVANVPGSVLSGNFCVANCSVLALSSVAMSVLPMFLTLSSAALSVLPNVHSWLCPQRQCLCCQLFSPGSVLSGNVCVANCSVLALSSDAVSVLPSVQSWLCPRTQCLCCQVFSPGSVLGRSVCVAKCSQLLGHAASEDRVRTHGAVWRTAAASLVRAALGINKLDPLSALTVKMGRKRRGGGGGGGGGAPTRNR